MKYNLLLQQDPPIAPFFELGRVASELTLGIVEQQRPELRDLFPFGGGFGVQGHIGQGWIAAHFVGVRGYGLPASGYLDPDVVQNLAQRIEPFTPRSYTELVALLGDGWFGFDRFTYVGPYRPPYASRDHFYAYIMDWLNSTVLPEVNNRNRTRVLRALPPSPQFDIEAIRSSLWVLESEEEAVQGTGFHLEGVGLVTCQHVLATGMYAHHVDNPFQRYNIKTNRAAMSQSIDLAVVGIDGALGPALRRGTADNLKQMDHIMVAGFPNYQRGDTGVMIPGLVVGFRMVRGIQRILTEAPIVAGTSGAPVIGAANRVIGVAVTGAERMEMAQQTENHGIIPIDALDHLSTP